MAQVAEKGVYFLIDLPEGAVTPTPVGGDTHWGVILKLPIIRARDPLVRGLRPPYVTSASSSTH